MNKNYKQYFYISYILMILLIIIIFNRVNNLFNHHTYPDGLERGFIKGYNIGYNRGAKAAMNIVYPGQCEKLNKKVDLVNDKELHKDWDDYDVDIKNYKKNLKK